MRKKYETAYVENAITYYSNQATDVGFPSNIIIFNV